MAITLYTNKASRGRIVHWMLEELGQPYAIEWVEYGADMKTAEYLSINPMGKVPALKHNDAVITETAAILTYLADAFPESELIPAVGSPARAAFYRWMFFIAGPLEAATTATFLDWKTPEKTPLGTHGSGFLGFGSLQLSLNALEQHLANNEFICGDQFTAADIYLNSHLTFTMLVTKVVPMNTVFKDYLKRTNDRPAKARVNETS